MSQVGSSPTTLRPAAGTPAVTGAAVTPTPTDQATGNAPRQQGGGGQPSPQQQPAPPPPAPPAPAVTLAGALTALFAGQPVQAVVSQSANGEIVVKLPEAQLILAAQAAEAAKAIEAARGDVLVLKLVAAGPNPTVIIASRNGRPVTDPAPLPITIEPVAEQPPTIVPAPRRPVPVVVPPMAAVPPPGPGSPAPIGPGAPPAGQPAPPHAQPAATASTTAAPAPIAASPVAAVPVAAAPDVPSPHPLHAADPVASGQPNLATDVAARSPSRPAATGPISAGAPVVAVSVSAKPPAPAAPQPLASPNLLSNFEALPLVVARPLTPAAQAAPQPVPAPASQIAAQQSPGTTQVAAHFDAPIGEPHAPGVETRVRSVAGPGLTSGQRPVPFVPPSLPDDAPRPSAAFAATVARSPFPSIPDGGVAASKSVAIDLPRPSPEARPAPPTAPAASTGTASPKAASAALFPIEVGPVPPEDAPIDRRAASAWTALWAAVRTDPVVAERIREMLQPGAGARLAGGLAFLVSALRGGKLADWLGTADSNRVDLPSRPDGRRTAEAEFRDLARMAQERGPDGWRAQPLAVLDGGAVQPVMLYVHRPPRRRKSDPGADEASEHFMLDLKLSRTGPMRIDGLLRPKALDLIIRTERAVPSRIQRDLRQLFGTALEGAGLAGTIGFQKVDRLPPPPMSADGKSHHAVLA